MVQTSASKHLFPSVEWVKLYQATLCFLVRARGFLVRRFLQVFVLKLTRNTQISNSKSQIGYTSNPKRKEKKGVGC